MSEKTEEQGIEVFGTKEVSVKEFMGLKDKSLVVLSNYELAKKNLEDLKSEHEARIEELISIDKLSPAELKELNSILSTVRKPRYLIQKLKKDNASVFAAYSKNDKSNWDYLISINEPLEDKASAKVDIEEERKKNEKAEEARLEQLRVDTIKNKIDEFETESYKIIQETKFAYIDANQIKLQALESAEFDYEEYDILFEQAKARIENQWNAKVADLQEKETQRLDNIRLEEEAKEQKRISDLQASRLNELLPFNTYGADVDMATLWSLEESVYSGILSSKKALFEADAKKKEEEEELAAAKLKEENDAIFEIRKKRLQDFGFKFVDEMEFVFRDTELSYLAKHIYNADAISFEEVFMVASTTLKDIEDKEKQELVKEKETESRIAKLLEIGLHHSDEHGTYFVAADSDWMVLTEDVADATPESFEEMLSEAVQVISDYKKSKEDAEKLKKENKARVKRLSADKKALTQLVDELEFHGVIPDLENEESNLFLESCFSKLVEFKKELLIELEKL